MTRRRLAFFVLGVALAVLVHEARAGLMGGVGVLMAPTGGNNGGGIPSNAIVTDTGLALATDTGAFIVTN